VPFRAVADAVERVLNDPRSSRTVDVHADALGGTPRPGA
jgi:hypothetical protein